MSKKNQKNNHYVYRLDDPITKEFYFGSRSCKCKIEDDPYMGSYCTWKPNNKARLVKTILKSNFRKREIAVRYEAILIKENIDNELNKNYHIPTIGFCGVGVKHPLYGKHHSNQSKEKNRISHIGIQDGKLNSFYGKKHTEETNEKNRIAHLGKRHIDEVKRKIGLAALGNKANLGKKLTDEHKQKISEAGKGRYHTDETKRKMSESQKGHIVTDETKRKIGNANKRNIGSMKGKFHSILTKQKMSESAKNQKKYICAYCGILTTKGNINRWHDDNCKLKIK